MSCSNETTMQYTYTFKFHREMWKVVSLCGNVDCDPAKTTIRVACVFSEILIWIPIFLGSMSLKLVEETWCGQNWDYQFSGWDVPLNYTVDRAVYFDIWLAKLGYNFTTFICSHRVLGSLIKSIPSAINQCATGFVRHYLPKLPSSNFHKT
jgi:hypothetical protein